MQLHQIDLNLLRLFDAVYRARSVSRAAEQLEMTQPAASQGLTRLRALIHDPLFVRAPGGVRPTPTAERLAQPVRQALVTLEQALGETAAFDPRESKRLFRIHMSDIGEARFLPQLMSAMRAQAPDVRIETMPLAREEIASALDTGRIDVAFGFLPTVKDTQKLQLLRDRYIVVLRRGHPFTRKRRMGKALLRELAQLEFVAVRTHAATLRILELLQLQERLRLTTEHFMVLPAIVKATDLAAIMPRSIAHGFGAGYAIVEPDVPHRDLTVALHWSKRFDNDPGNRWLRGLVEQLFRER